MKDLVKNSLKIILASITGGFISRWHGGGYFHSPKFWRNSAWALPFAAVVWYTTQTWWMGIIAFLLCFLGKTLGHGRFMSLNLPMKGDPEKIEYLILWLYGKIPLYWYKCLGLALVGLTAVSGAALLPWLDASIVLLAGLVGKPVGYMIGWAISPNYRSLLGSATAWGEFLTGVFVFAALGWVVFNAI